MFVENTIQVSNEYYRAHTKDLFSKLNILPIHDRANYRMVCTASKSLHNQMPEYIANMFESKTRTATRNTTEHAIKIANRILDVSRRGLVCKGAVILTII